MSAPEIGCRQRRGLGPAFHRDEAVARIDADRHLPGKGLRRLADETGVAHRGGADDDAADTLGKPALDRLHVTDAATKLHREGDPRQDGLDRGRIHRLAGEGAVEIDDVEPLEALRLEGGALCSGIVVEDRRLVHVALFQAHALAVLEIDGGEEDHGFHLRKLASSRSPSVWLFSGWNWVPAMLSRPTMAVTDPPWSVTAITSPG